ncbi:hypothetical protein C8F01DRAFT_1181609, partial [Mycena amicta]
MSVPTLDDLRLKKCFICLEEQGAGIAKDPWIHPCPDCALLAHESCLIRWTATLPVKNPTSGSAQSLFVLDSFRCPRCRRPYELAEPLSPRLHTLIIISNTLYRTISGLVDTAFTGAGLLLIEVIPLSLSFQSRMVMLSGMIGYELAFLRSYLGLTMFRLFQPAKPSDLLRSLSISLPTLPFRLLLPGTVPQWIVPLYATLPPFLYALTEVGTLHPPRLLSPTPTTATTTAEPPLPSPWTRAQLYPPTPLLLGLLTPTILRPAYTSLKTRLATYLLGVPPPPRPRRYLTERIRAVFTFPFGRRTTRAGAAALNPPARNANNEQQPQDIVVQEEDPTPLLLATRIIQKDQKSITHDVLHAIAALVLPHAIGTVLRLVALSGGDNGWRGLLRRFLCVSSAAQISATQSTTSSTSGNGDSRKVLRTIAGLFLGGVGVWAERDPIWWHTTVGWGVYVVAKDLLELYRLWLQTAEVRSRVIRNRDFAGVDVGQLELIDPERFA